MIIATRIPGYGKLKFFEMTNQRGATARVYVSACKQIVLKHVVHYSGRDCYKREIFMLTYLRSQGAQWVPQIIGADNANSRFAMTYCGERLTHANAPPNAREQLRSMIRLMEKAGVQHNDIKPDQILVNNGQLFLCDWGWASLRGCMDCGIGLCNKEKPCPRIYASSDREGVKKLCSELRLQ